MPTTTGQTTSEGGRTPGRAEVETTGAEARKGSSPAQGLLRLERRDVHHPQVPLRPRVCWVWGPTQEGGVQASGRRETRGERPRPLVEENPEHWREIENSEH